MANEIERMKRQMAATTEMIGQMSKATEEMIGVLENMPWGRLDRQEKLFNLEMLGRALLYQRLCKTNRIVVNSNAAALYKAFDEKDRPIHPSAPFEEFFGPYVDTGVIMGKADE